TPADGPDPLPGHPSPPIPTPGPGRDPIPNTPKPVPPVRPRGCPAEPLPNLPTRPPAFYTIDDGSFPPGSGGWALGPPAPKSETAHSIPRVRSIPGKGWGPSPAEARPALAGALPTRPAGSP